MCRGISQETQFCPDVMLPGLGWITKTDSNSALLRKSKSLPTDKSFQDQIR